MVGRGKKEQKKLQKGNCKIYKQLNGSIFQSIHLTVIAMVTLVFVPNESNHLYILHYSFGRDRKVFKDSIIPCFP